VYFVKGSFYRSCWVGVGGGGWGGGREVQTERDVSCGVWHYSFISRVSLLSHTRSTLRTICRDLKLLCVL